MQNATREHLPLPMREDGRVPTQEIDRFGVGVADAVAGVLGVDLVGVYFVGSVAVGGYVPGESDVDVVAVSEVALSDQQRRSIASAIVDASARCPARGLEFTMYCRDVAGSQPKGADFEVNVNGGPRMDTAIHLEPGSEPGFWYVLDRAIAYRSGVAIVGPPPRTIFVEVPRDTLLGAMHQSMVWHRANERGTFYSVLNACRAWRYAEEDVLGSKLEGATWAATRWPDEDVINAAVALRRGQVAVLDASAVDALLEAVARHLREALEH